MVGAFGVNHDTPRVWTAGEIELVREVAERTWDAVERTRAEAALREQKTRLRLALEASAGGSWTWDLRTNDADWDDASAHDSGSRRKKRQYSRRGSHVCTSKTVRVRRNSKRFCRRRIRGITHTVPAP
jgi:PAS domain-containing protein